MKCLSGPTGQEWVPLEVSGNAGPEERLAAEERRRILTEFLTGFLLSEHLVVLAGLGTSLAVRDAQGTVLAPTMPQLWDAAKEKAGNAFHAILDQCKYATPEGGDNIEFLLSQCQLSQALTPSAAVGTFISDTEGLIVAQCRFIEENVSLSIHEAFLRKLVRRSIRKPRFKLFTTNYDLCFETAASRIRFVVVDGFSHTQPQEFDGSHFSYDFVRRGNERDAPDYIPNVFHLYKMHGSVDWMLAGDHIIKAVKPETPLIIYPRHTKFEASYTQPFLEMMSRFQLVLRQSNTGVLVIGSGFNDRHINELLLAAVRANVGLKEVVVAPHLDTSTTPAVKELVALVKAGDSRILLLAATFEELAQALPDLVAPTEEEQHQVRVRSARAIGN